MTLPTGLYQDNVNRSIFAQLHTSWASISPYDTRVGWQDPVVFDPTGLSDLITKLGYWINVQIVAEGVGRKVPTIVQFDTYYRVGHRGTVATSDPQGLLSTQIRRTIQAALPRYGFKIYDYTADLGSPTDTGHWLLIRNRQGQVGFLDETRVLPPEGGLRHDATTLRAWHHLDLIRTPIYT